MKEWNPMLLFSVPPGCHITMLVSFQITVRCRGVRYRETDIRDAVLQPTYGTLKAKVWQQNPKGQWQIAQYDGYEIPAGAMQAFSGKTPVFYTNDEWYKQEPTTVNHGGIAGIVGAGDSVANVRYLTQLHFPRVINDPAGFDAANCVVQGMTMKSFQQGLYGDESVAYQDQAYGLKVSGKDMYSESYGGIKAEGYMDLMPPPRDDQTGADYSEMAAWTSVSGKTQEEVGSLNLITTYPAYKPVINYTKAITKAKTNFLYRDDADGFKFGSGPENFSSYVPIGVAYSWALTDDDVAMLHAVGAQIRVYTAEASAITASYVFPDWDAPMVGDYDYMKYTNADGVSDNLKICMVVPKYIHSTTQASVPPGRFASKIELAAGVELEFDVAKRLWQFLTKSIDWQYGVTGQVVDEKTTSVWVGTPVPTIVGGAYNNSFAAIVSAQPDPTQYFDAYAVLQGKVWQRIKGFFKKVFRATTTWLPKIAAVASKVLPPPAGTVVGAVGMATSALGVVVKVISGVKNVTATTLTGQPDITDEDGFKCTVQYAYAPNGANALDPTGDDSAWKDADTFVVPLTSTRATEQYSYINYQSNPEVKAQIDRYLTARQLGMSKDEVDADIPLQVQTRLKVVFEKKMTKEQAENFEARMLLGSSVFPLQTIDV